MRMSRVMISSLNLVFERDGEVKSVTLACEYYLGPKNTVVMRDPDGIIGTLSSNLLYITSTISKHYFDDSLHPRVHRIP